MLKPKKSLGQNYLQDENILNKIASSLMLNNGDVVVEIGSGHGALTKYLNKRDVDLLCVEIDDRAIDVLRSKFKDINIIHSDILNYDIKKISQYYNKKVRVVGNIPYYITSDIIFWIFNAYDSIIDATIMMQYEVAKRLTAKVGTKDYGILTVFTQFYSECKMLFKVSRNCFFPKPDVDSAVVKFNLKKTLPECNKELFISIVRNTFGKRRKTLKNGLKYLNLKDDEISSVKFDLTRRPEQCTLDDFLLLTKMVDDIIKND